MPPPRRGESGGRGKRIEEIVEGGRRNPGVLAIPLLRAFGRPDAEDDPDAQAAALILLDLLFDIAMGGVKDKWRK
jgi:hypothetical protein